MKKLLLIPLILISVFISILQAQTVSVVIEGHVKDVVTTAPIPNHIVYIVADSSSSMFGYFNAVTTDSSGYYYDLVDVPAGNQIMFDISTIDCNGTFHNAIGVSTNSPIVNDFLICTQGTVQCSAAFYTYPDSLSQYAFQFVDMSTPNPDTWLWDFGDGSSSTQQNPYHIYNNSGAYIVCLTITSGSPGTGNFCQDTYCDSLIVSGSSTNCSNYFTLVDSNLTVIFTGNSNSTAYTYYSWDFGDGNYGNGQQVSHTYAQAGSYQVCLMTVDSNSCSYTSCQNIYLTSGVYCNAAYTYYPDSLLSLGVYFQDLSTPQPNTWLWEFGDGTTSTVQNPYHVYNSPGSYNVCLTITTGSVLTGNFCQDNYCNTVFVDSIVGQCYNDFTYSVSNLSVDFYGSAYPNNSVYSWDFGDGNNASGKNVSHTYAASGNYMVNLVTTDYQTGCSYTSTQWVTVGNSVFCNADFYIVPDSNNNMTFHFIDISAGNPYSWFWEFGDGNTSTLQSPTHTYTTSGIYGVCLTITCDTNGTTAWHCDTLFVNTIPTGTLFGTISMGGTTADFAEVYLIEYDSVANTLTAVDTVYTSNNPGNLGHYQFWNVIPGTYLVKAALLQASASYANYMPTYYINTLWWDYATNVFVNYPYTTADINLIPGNNTGGPGFIGGNVTQGANKFAPGDAIPDVEILLLSMNDDPHLYTYTDGNGDYGFSNLAYGTYKVWAEVMGKFTTPAIVIIDANNQTITDIDLVVNTTNVTTSVNDNISSFVESVSDIYPNPVGDEISVEVSFTLDSELKLEVYNQIGQMVYSRTVKESAGQQMIKINTSNLNGGVYSLWITTEDNAQIMRKFVKIN